MKPAYDDPSDRQQRAAAAIEECRGLRGQLLRWAEPRFTVVAMAGWLLLARLAYRGNLR